MRRKKITDHNTGRILVAKEKHATRYFDAQTDEKLYEAALILLKERMDPEYGYIRPPGLTTQWYKAEHLLTDEQIMALPNPALVKKADDDRRIARQGKRDYDEQVLMWQTASAAKRAKDGAAAWEILLERADYEYEQVRFEHLENV